MSVTITSGGQTIGSLQSKVAPGGGSLQNDVTSTSVTISSGQTATQLALSQIWAGVPGPQGPAGPQGLPGAAVATTPTLLQWFLGVDGTAVTLASNNFRKSIGAQNLPVGAAVGAQANTLDCRFSSPFVTNSGRFFHIGLKMPVGTATASQIVRGVASVEGYFE